MLDKNSLSRTETRDKRQRFSIRKFNVGVASVAVAAFFMVNGASVAADSLDSPAIDTVEVAEPTEEQPLAEEAPALLESVADEVVEEMAEQAVDEAAEVAESDSQAAADLEAEPEVELVAEASDEVVAEVDEEKAETPAPEKSAPTAESQPAASTPVQTEQSVRVATATTSVRYVDEETGQVVYQRNYTTSQETSASQEVANDFEVTVALELETATALSGYSLSENQEVTIRDNAIEAIVSERNNRLTVKVRRDDVAASDGEEGDEFTVLRAEEEKEILIARYVDRQGKELQESATVTGYPPNSILTEDGQAYLYITTSRESNGDETIITYTYDRIVGHYLDREGNELQPSEFITSRSDYPGSITGTDGQTYLYISNSGINYDGETTSITYTYAKVVGHYLDREGKELQASEFITSRYGYPDRITGTDGQTYLYISNSGINDDGKTRSITYTYDKVVGHYLDREGKELQASEFITSRYGYPDRIIGTDGQTYFYSERSGVEYDGKVSSVTYIYELREARLVDRLGKEIQSPIMIDGETFTRPSMITGSDGRSYHFAPTFSSSKLEGDKRVYTYTYELREARFVDSSGKEIQSPIFLDELDISRPTTIIGSEGQTYRYFMSRRTIDGVSTINTYFYDSQFLVRYVDGKGEEVKPPVTVDDYTSALEDTITGTDGTTYYYRWTNMTAEEDVTVITYTYVPKSESNGRPINDGGITNKLSERAYDYYASIIYLNGRPAVYVTSDGLGYDGITYLGRESARQETIDLWKSGTTTNFFISNNYVFSGANNPDGTGRGLDYTQYPAAGNHIAQQILMIQNGYGYEQGIDTVNIDFSEYIVLADQLVDAGYSASIIGIRTSNIPTGLTYNYETGVLSGKIEAGIENAGNYISISVALVGPDGNIVSTNGDVSKWNIVYQDETPPVIEVTDIYSAVANENLKVQMVYPTEAEQLAAKEAYERGEAEFYFNVKDNGWAVPYGEVVRDENGQMTQVTGQLDYNDYYGRKNTATEAITENYNRNSVLSVDFDLKLENENIQANNYDIYYDYTDGTLNVQSNVAGIYTVTVTSNDYKFSKEMQGTTLGPWDYLLSPQESQATFTLHILPTIEVADVTSTSDDLEVTVAAGSSKATLTLPDGTEYSISLVDGEWFNQDGVKLEASTEEDTGKIMLKAPVNARHLTQTGDQAIRASVRTADGLENTGTGRVMLTGDVIVRYHIVDRDGNVLIQDAMPSVDAVRDGNIGDNYDTSYLSQTSITVDGKEYLRVDLNGTNPKPYTDGDAETGIVEADVTKVVNYYYEEVKPEEPITPIEEPKVVEVKTGEITVRYLSVSEDGTITPLSVEEVHIRLEAGTNYDTFAFKSETINVEGENWYLVNDLTEGEEIGQVEANVTKEIYYFYKQATTEVTTIPVYGDVVIHYVNREGQVIKPALLDTNQGLVAELHRTTQIAPNGNVISETMVREEVDNLYDTTEADERPETIVTEDGLTYRLVDVEGEEQGYIGEGVTHVTYIYDLALGSVQVRYHLVDADGNPLLTDVISPRLVKADAPVGETYSSLAEREESISFIGKTFRLVPELTEGGEEGTILEGTQVINYYYTEVLPEPQIIEVIKEVEVERLVEVTKEVPVEVIREIPVEVIREVEVEKIVEVIQEVPVEVIKEIPVEVIREVEVEKIVEVIQEVPVEVIKEIPVEVIREVEVEKIVEVIQEVPVEVIKEIPVEVIREIEVEKIVEVIQEVPVEVIKEIPVEIIREIEVEKIVEVIQEVPVEVIKEIPVEVIREVEVEKIVEIIKEVEVETPAPVVTTVYRQTDTGVEQVEVTELGGQTTERVLATFTNSRTTEVLPYRTERQDDADLEAGTQQVILSGVNGQLVTGTTYTVVDGQLVTTPINERTEPVTEIIAVGTKVAQPVVTTVYRQTNTGVEQVEVTELNGQTTERVLATYTNSRTSEVLPYNTERQDDANLDAGVEQVIQSGVNGQVVAGTTYTVVDGQLVSTPVNERTEPVTQIIAVGTKLPAAVVEPSQEPAEDKPTVGADDYRGELVAQKEDLQHRLSEIDAQIGEAEALMAEEYAYGQVLSANLQHLQDDLGTVQEKLTQVNAELSSLKSSLARVDSAIASRETELAELKKNSPQAQLLTEIEQIEADIKTKTDRIAEIDRLLPQKRAELAALQDESALDAKIAQKQGEYDQLVAKQASVQASVDAKKKERESYRQTQQSSINQMKAKLATLGQKVTTIVNEDTVLNIPVEDYRKKSQDAWVKNVRDNAKNTVKQELVRFTGDREEIIYLTEAQAKEYQETGKFTYVPNEAQVEKYFYQYLKEIRQNNGISIPLEESAEATDYSRRRARENAALNGGAGKLTHDTNQPDKKTAGYENAGLLVLGERFKSDQEVAYYLAFNWFSDYTNVGSNQAANGGYGHRNNLLLGSHMADKTNGAIQRLATDHGNGLGLYQSTAVDTTYEYNSKYQEKWWHYLQNGYRYTWESGSSPIAITRDAKNNQYLTINGKTSATVFMDALSFKYVVKGETKTIVNQDYVNLEKQIEQAERALTNRLKSYDTEIAQLEAQKPDLTAVAQELADLKETKKQLPAKRQKLEAEIKALETERAQHEADLITLNQQLAAKVAELADDATLDRQRELEAELAELRSQRQELVAAIADKEAERDELQLQEQDLAQDIARLQEDILAHELSMQEFDSLLTVTLLKRNEIADYIVVADDLIDDLDNYDQRNRLVEPEVVVGGAASTVTPETDQKPAPVAEPASKPEPTDQAGKQTVGGAAGIGQGAATQASKPVAVAVNKPVQAAGQGQAVASATEQALPNTGEATSLVALLGASMLTTAGVGIKRRKK